MKTADASRADLEVPVAFLRSPGKILLWRALVAGERFHKHSAAARFGFHLSTADRAINELHADDKVHVVGWTRNGARGPMTKVVEFGPGEDVPRPAKLTNAFVCSRWRNRHYEQAQRIDRQCRVNRMVRQGRLPVVVDPLLAAIMGMLRAEMEGVA